MKTEEQIAAEEAWYETEKVWLVHKDGFSLGASGEAQRADGWASRISGLGVPPGLAEGWVISQEKLVIQWGGGRTTKSPKRVAKASQARLTLFPLLCRHSAQI